jgi:hypothetical protein
MSLTLEYIKSCVDNLASKINAPNNVLPTYGKSYYGPTSYVDIDNKDRLIYVIPGDRGDDKHIEAVDLDHLLFIIFKSVTGSMAMNLYLKNPQPNVDNRRQRFKIQLELLEKLNKDWKDMVERDQKSIIMLSPFNDYEGKRESYLRELIGNGFLHDEAVKKAYEKYP